MLNPDCAGEVTGLSPHRPARKYYLQAGTQVRQRIYLTRAETSTRQFVVRARLTAGRDPGLLKNADKKCGTATWLLASAFWRSRAIASPLIASAGFGHDKNLEL